MAICPKCHEKIGYLCRWQSGERKTELYPDGDYDEGEESFVENNKVDEFECPSCNEVLFIDEEKALKFLKDVDKLKELVAEKLKKNACL